VAVFSSPTDMPALGALAPVAVPAAYAPLPGHAVAARPNTNLTVCAVRQAIYPATVATTTAEPESVACASAGRSELRGWA